jgi:hypothetical protein
VEIEDTHTPLDPRAGALVNTQAHGENLHQWRQHKQPHASVHPQCNSEPNACNVSSSARAHAHHVQQAIVVDANGPPQFARAKQNIAAAALLLCNLPELAEPQ